jgi:hypothetical protein
MAKRSLTCSAKAKLRRRSAGSWTFSSKFKLKWKLRRLSVVMLQHPSAPLSAPDRTPQNPLTDFLRRWLSPQRRVLQRLMRPLRVVQPHNPLRRIPPLKMWYFIVFTRSAESRWKFFEFVLVEGVSSIALVVLPERLEPPWKFQAGCSIPVPVINASCVNSPISMYQACSYWHSGLSNEKAFLAA